MAGFESALNDITSAFQTAWSAAEPSVPAYFPNSPRAGSQPQASGEHIDIAVRESVSGRLPEIGSRLAEIRGLVVVRVFVPHGTGTGRIRELCDSVRDILQSVRLGDVRLLASNHDVVGPSDNGALWQENVITPFWFESTPV